MQREFRTSRMQRDHQIRLVDSCVTDVPRVSSRSSVRVGKNVVPLATDKKLNSVQLCLPFEPVVSRDEIATLVRVYLLIQECRRVRLDVLVNHIAAQLKCDEKIVHQAITSFDFARIKLTNGVAFVSLATATSRKKISDVKLMQFEEAMSKLFADSQGERIQLSHVINVLNSVLKRRKQHCYQMLRASSEYEVVGSVATGKYVYKYASN
jgi:hypothetical protein